MSSAPSALETIIEIKKRPLLLEADPSCSVRRGCAGVMIELTFQSCCNVLEEACQSFRVSLLPPRVQKYVPRAAVEIHDTIRRLDSSH